jgi:Ni/Fe-hydrogenase 1 B-type cytochrome subunit
MGWVRFIHFTAAYAFMLSLLIRLYWAFMGNRFANWRVFLPLRAEQWRDMVNAARFYLFMEKKPPYAVGHTALAGPYYLLFFLLFAFEIVSGFALYSQSMHGVLWTMLGGWLLGVMHVQTVRLLHHMVMYVVLVMSALHVYIAWWLDTAEKNGLMDSIFSGYKFISGKELE